MDCECYATKGIGETHAKWSPVCTAAYRMRPQITFPAPVTGEDAERLRGEFDGRAGDLELPHGGIFVVPVMGNAGMYLVALAVGTVISAVLLGLLKKKVNE